MDMSETYIKMCDCPEVQEQDCGGLYKMGTPFGDVLFYTNDKKGCSDDAWLPRQDQIQEMCEGSWWGGYCNMTYWADSKHFPYVIDEMHSGTLLKSMEQLWLAFYMHEKHQKHWDGKSWV